MNPISARHRLSMVAAPLAAAGMMVSAQSPMRAYAQATPEAGTSAMTPSISVTGLGEVIVVPDTANIQIGVQVFSEELAAAQRMSNEQISAIIDSLTKAGIEERDIQTSNYSVSVRQQYDNQGIATAVLGYDIYNTLSVTVRDVDTLGEILDRAVSAGANQIYGIFFFTEDLTEATSQARVKAVEDARARAEQLARAAGVTVGPVLNITEGFAQGPMPFDYGRGFAAADAQMAGAEVPIQTGSQTVQIHVTVTFGIVE